MHAHVVHPQLMWRVEWWDDPDGAQVGVVRKELLPQVLRALEVLQHPCHEHAAASTPTLAFRGGAA